MLCTVGDAANIYIFFTDSRGNCSLWKSIHDCRGSKWVLPGVDRGHLGLRNSSCSATETATHLSLTTPLDGCLTSATETSTSLIYSTKVREIPSDMIMNGAVTRKRQVTIPFRRQYSKSGMVRRPRWVGSLKLTGSTLRAEWISPWPWICFQTVALQLVTLRRTCQFW